MKLIMYYVGLVILSILFVLMMWQITRVWNYNLSYKGMVQRTITDMVKPECLK